MVELNLPSFECNIKNENGQQVIFDIIRKKFLVLTPEEWVRQHFIHFLINHHSYPKNLISCEQSLTYNGRSKRSDILVYDKNTKPFLLIECKAPEIKLNQEVVNQASVYNAKIKAPYLLITNGINTFCWKIKEGEFIQLKNVPDYGT
jgi:hypothetical protein